MAVKIFKFHGKTMDEIKKLSDEEFLKLIPSRPRRRPRMPRTSCASVPLCFLLFAALGPVCAFGALGCCV